MSDTKLQVDELKGKGNAAIADGNIEEAIGFYSEAISFDPENAILYSNRSAAYCKSTKYSEALEDADKAISLKPGWGKGYSRKGAALGFMKKHEEAMMAYLEGLDHDPTNQQLKDAIKESKSRLTGPAGSQPLMNPFADPNLWSRLETDPRTKTFMTDPEYKKIIRSLQANPKDLGKYMQDSRVMTAIGVLLGVDLNVMENEEMNGQTDEPMDQAPAPEKSTPQTSKQKQANVNDEQKQAGIEKELGNAEYKRKNFKVALEHYSKSIELDPTNIVYRNNRAAVYFEQKEYDQCIEECHKAVEIGRENRADYKLLAKPLARIGTAYFKKDDLENALAFYNKSLSEYRDQEIVKKSIQIGKAVKEKARLSYIDPEKSLEEKQNGNICFQKGEYPEALKFYTEAIKRNSDDPKLFSNRAACFTKVAEFNMALRDCDECIRLDPKFVKGYLRKGATLMALKQLTKAGEVYQKALEIDPNCQEAIDGYKKTVMSDNDPESVKQRAMQDPEVQEILGDPAMQMILQQMQKDPRALQEHLQNPQIAKKIEKLLEVGLIAIR